MASLEKAPPCFICGAPRAWADVGWTNRAAPGPERDRCLVEGARCDDCREVETRLARFIAHPRGRAIVRDALHDLDLTAPIPTPNAEDPE